MGSLSLINNEVDPFWNFFDGTDTHLPNLLRQRRSLVSNWAPAVDIVEGGGFVKIQVDLPGLTKKDIHISVEGNVLSIEGERKYENEEAERHGYRYERSYGKFSRAFTLSDEVDVSDIKASMKDGVLQIAIPKKEEAKPKKIEVAVE
jgi:HSP20 family protein